VEIYSVGDIAAAANVPVSHVTARVVRGGIRTARGYVGEADAIALVRSIVSAEPPPSDYPTFAAVVIATERRGLFGLMTSSALHVLAGTILIVSSLAWLTAATDESEPKTPARLVYLMTPGPGGGGGGGGLKIPAPARRAERKAPAPRVVSSPIPEVREEPPPPPEPKPEPKVETPPPPPPPVVQAPVASKPADPVESPGVVTPPPDPPPANQGAGAGGGAGTGRGAGIGEGDGPGIGPGSGGGEGGGPYRPGAGIDPPSLQREVKALYTDDARRRGIEGDVVLEIVVRRDGSVGDVRVRRSLDRGLDQKAIEAVRQWRFAPARRHGVAVDVIVEVAVAFKLR
jgi:TonB family protein